MNNNLQQKVKGMVKWSLLFCLFAFLPLNVSAQGKFGYLSYDAVLKAMPEYAIAEQNLANLTAQYESEVKRAEDEFNTKYEQFLDGQHEFPQTILQKRQRELQELMEKNIAFKEESKRLLATAREEAFAPLHQRLSDALQSVGTQRGLAFIINTDQNACPFINPEMGVDVSGDVLNLLNK
jgi:outer membrane protein